MIMEQGIIAQIATKLDEPVVIAMVVLFGLAAIATAINQVWKVVDRVRGKNMSQPLEVKAATVFVRQEECLQRNQQTKAELERIEREVKTLRVDREKDVVNADDARRRLYNQMDSVRKELSDKIDTMPERMMNTLSTLGVLRKPGHRD
jgi:hypothetical protein